MAGAANAAKHAPSHVSIRVLSAHRLVGFVTGSRRCTHRRRVAVLESARRPGSRGNLVATVRTRRDAGGYQQWTAKIRRRGSYRAKVIRRPGCGVARSRRLHVLPHAPRDFPSCYDPRQAARRPNEAACKFPYKVHIDIRYGDTIALPCPGFGDHATANCHGTSNSSTDQMPEDWATGFAPHGHFDWINHTGGREVSWDLYSSGGYLTGTLPGPNRADWSISAAGLNGDNGRPLPGPKWFSPNLPGKDPGTLGGPLYMDFRNAWFGADVFFWGYLLLGPGSR
jgi:hypothetical protein